MPSSAWPPLKPMVTVKIRGKEFPLCLTVAAVDQLNEKCGGIGGVMDFLRGNPEQVEGLNEEQLQQLDMEAASRAKYNNAWMLGLLIREGEENRIMEARFESGGDTERRSVPGPEGMVHLLTPGQIEDYRLSIIMAVNESLKRTLEATPKNGYQGAEG